MKARPPAATQRSAYWIFPWAGMSWSIRIVSASSGSCTSSQPRAASAFAIATDLPWWSSTITRTPAIRRVIVEGSGVLRRVRVHDLGDAARHAEGAAAVVERAAGCGHGRAPVRRGEQGRDEPGEPRHELGVARAAGVEAGAGGG